MNAVRPPEEGLPIPLPEKIPQFNRNNKIAQKTSSGSLLIQTLARWLNVFINIFQNPLAAKYVDKTQRDELVKRINNEIVTISRVHEGFFHLIGPHIEHFSKENLLKTLGMLITFSNFEGRHPEYLTIFVPLFGTLRLLREDISQKNLYNEIIQIGISNLKFHLKEEPESTQLKILQLLYLAVRTVYKDEEIKELKFF